MNSLSRGVIRRSHRVVGGLGRASGWHGEPADCDGRMFELRRRSTRFRVQLKALCARKNGLLLASSGKDKPLHQGLGTTHTHSLWCVLCLYVCMSVCMCVCVYVHVCVCVCMRATVEPFKITLLPSQLSEALRAVPCNRRPAWLCCCYARLGSCEGIAFFRKLN